MALSMRTIRYRRYRYLVGDKPELPLFFPSEAIELSRTSRAGMKAPYFRAMVASRRRLRDNAIRNGWTERQYHDYIKGLYVEGGHIKLDKLGRRVVDVWSKLREYESKRREAGLEYESPWREKTKTRTVRKRERKRETRRAVIVDWIKRLNGIIARTKLPELRRRYEKQRDRLQKILDNMD